MQARDLKTDDEKIQRGQNAKLLIESDAFKDTMQEMYDSLHAAIDCLPTDDKDRLVSISGQLRAIKTVISKLDTWVQESRRLANVRAH